MGNYSFLDQILNKQFLGNNQLANYLYQRILNKNFSKDSLSKKQHIFITGLARSGSTAILNQLYESNQLCSFLYKHMPFILAPKLAHLASSLINDTKKKTERLHNDGLFIDNNSPECLDEIFWIKSTKNYYKCDLTEPQKIDIKVLRGYENLITSYSKLQSDKRLIIKNNNNHIRLKCLAEYFGYCYFLIIFRDPISQAYSLMRCHKRFCELQEKDNYILDYMNLIGHREFGKGIKKFIYNNSSTKSEYSSHSINYWLKQWIECYGWILENKLYKKENVYLICYEKICSNKSYLKKIYSILNLKFDNKKNLILKNRLSDKDKTKLGMNPELVQLSNIIYRKLISYC